MRPMQNTVVNVADQKRSGRLALRMSAEWSKASVVTCTNWLLHLVELLQLRECFTSVLADGGLLVRVD